MNKNEIANEIQETERKLADLRKRLEEPEEWGPHEVSCWTKSWEMEDGGCGVQLAVGFRTKEQAEYARPILEKMNFNKPPTDDEMVMDEAGYAWPYRDCGRLNRDSRWLMGLIKRAK